MVANKEFFSTRYQYDLKAMNKLCRIKICYIWVKKKLPEEEASLLPLSFKSEEKFIKKICAKPK